MKKCGDHTVLYCYVCYGTWHGYGSSGCYCCCIALSFLASGPELPNKQTSTNHSCGSQFQATISMATLRLSHFSGVFLSYRRPHPTSGGTSSDHWNSNEPRHSDT